MNKKQFSILPLIAIMLGGCQKVEIFTFINGLPEGGNEIEFTEENASIYESKLISCLSESVDSISDAFNISLKCDIPNMVYSNNEESEDNSIHFGIDADKLTFLIEGAAYGLSGSPKEIEAYLEGSKFNGSYSINAWNIDMTGTFKNGSFGAYITDNSVAVDFTNKGFMDGLVGITQFVLGYFEKDNTELDAIQTLNALSKKVRAKSIFNSDTPIFPEIDSSIYQQIAETVFTVLTYIDGNVITAKEYDNGSFGFQLKLDSNFIDEFLSFDLSDGDNVDYAISNGTCLNLVILFDEQARLSTISLEINANYIAKTVYPGESEIGLPTFYKDFSLIGNGSIELDLSYDKKDIIFPDFSDFGTIDISQFIK